MKKLFLILLVVAVVVVVGLGATRAYTSSDRSAHQKHKAMAEVFALAGEGYRLGVVLSEINPHLRDDLNVESGVLVDEVLPGSAAEKAGLKDGDIIVSIDGKKVESEKDIRRTMRNLDDPKPVSLDVVRDGKPLKLTVTPEKREISLLHNFGGPYIGVELQEMDDDLAGYFQTSPDAGILIARVERGSPADKAGLKSGDVITQLNGQKISSHSDLRKALDDVKEGETASLSVLRRGKSQTFTVKPEQRKFHLPEVEELGELGNLENLRELRNLPNRPEFRESMQQLREDMKQLKREMEELKRELRESD